MMNAIGLVACIGNVRRFPRPHKLASDLVSRFGSSYQVGGEILCVRDLGRTNQELASRDTRTPSAGPPAKWSFGTDGHISGGGEG